METGRSASDLIEQNIIQLKKELEEFCLKYPSQRSLVEAGKLSSEDGNSGQWLIDIPKISDDVHAGRTRPLKLIKSDLEEQNIKLKEITFVEMEEFRQRLNYFDELSDSIRMLSRKGDLNNSDSIIDSSFDHENSTALLRDLNDEKFVIENEEFQFICESYSLSRIIRDENYCLMDFDNKLGTYSWNGIGKNYCPAFGDFLNCLFLLGVIKFNKSKAKVSRYFSGIFTVSVKHEKFIASFLVSPSEKDSFNTTSSIFYSDLKNVLLKYRKK